MDMHPKWFKDEICEELQGAAEYWKCAIDTMKARPEWSKKFAKMAHMEQEHATCLYKMFVEMYAESQGQDTYMTSMRDAIMDCFSKQMRTIEDHKITYDMMMEGKEVETEEMGMEDEMLYQQTRIPVDFG